MQPDMAHAMVEIIRNSEADQLDSAEYYFQQSTKLIPAWVEPYVAMSFFYELKLKEPEKAEEMLNIAGQVDSASVLVWYAKANFFNHKKIIITLKNGS
ncbi:MAG: hypothetical protein IPL49_17005 [Saprospirales bacterium]|nr:hypothetical protein [Saprospirales bacterium]